MQGVQEKDERLGADEKTPLLHEQSWEDISTTEECRT
jgi:hypothetical protein